MTNSQMVRDLARHFQDRLIQISHDELDTARRAELEDDDILLIIMQSLLQYAAYTAICHDATRNDFLNACSLIYDDMKKGQIRYEAGARR